MTESARPAEGPPHGTMAEEAAKLAEVAQLWLASRSVGADNDDVWAAATAEPQTAECTGCPVCRARRLVGNVNPEVYGHLSDAAGSLVAALRSMSRDHDRR